jgi:copper ion binding protein
MEKSEVDRGVIIYFSPTCADCSEARRQLDMLGVAYDARDINDETNAKELMDAYGSSVTPTIIVDGKVFRGFARQRTAIMETLMEGGFVGAADSEEAGEPVERADGGKGTARVRIPITGMHCASCVDKVEKGLARLEGVESASVNFASETAEVTYDPDRVTPAKFIEEIKSLGYEPHVSHVMLPIEGMSCASCVQKVENSLRKVSGVVEANVNFANETAHRRRTSPT